MSADVLAPAVLSYVTNNVYPDSESISSSTLDAASLSQLLEELRKEQDAAKTSIRDLSRTAAPDIDTWISHAKTLQLDIQRSRNTARQIVADAEAGRELRADVEDKAKKLELLEKEVTFNESLTGTLEHVRYANGLLDRAREEAVVADVKRSLATLEGAEASIAALPGGAGSRAVKVLRERAEQLREGSKETISECWDGLIHANVEERWIKIERHGLTTHLPDAAVPELNLETIVVGAQGLGTFESLTQKLAKDIERAILKPRMSTDEDGQVSFIEVRHGKISCVGKSENVSSEALFGDLRTVLDFVSSHLPTSVAVPLSAELVPALSSRLESHWLDPAIPVSMQELPDFQSLLEDVSELADQIDGFGWSGTRTLREWTQNAPRAWLTKRREAVLGDVRNLVYEGLRERKAVERVETRVVNREDVGLADEDDWDDAWNETEEEPPASAPKSQMVQEDVDEASAWELEDDKDSASSKRHDAEDDADAWGWGDDEQRPASPVVTKKQPASSSATKPKGDSSNQEQELTLRETFTVTAIPDGLLAILKQTITDAQTLGGPQYSSSPIAPAATALYTLPTLALAIYRATASTAYGKVDDGTANMLLYNDASRLADQLREWQTSQPAQSRLKVDNDVTALETFAKRAYSSEMEAQRTILKDLLDGAQGFANCTQHPFKTECEGAIDATLDRMRDVHRLWKGVLSQGALLQSLGSLLSTATGKIISDIEDLGDISEPESLQLKALCDKVLAVRDIFMQVKAGTDAGSEGGEGQDMTFIYSPTWLKFQYLTEILESSLADIKWMFEEGGLALEFGPEEIVELVEALFEDSERRRGVIRAVRRGG